MVNQGDRRVPDDLDLFSPGGNAGSGRSASPVILLQVIMGMIGALQIFTIAMFVRPTTAAGKFMNQLVYERGFTQLHMGEASAVAWVHYESDVRR